ncbi:MAG: imelysin family protein [Labilithrix sp.]
MKLARRDVLIGLGVVLAAGGGARGLLACRHDQGTDPPDRGQILTDLTNKVIVPTYSDSVTDATALEVSLGALRDAPTADSLASARAAWKKARATWKASDAFLFGPASTNATSSGAVDSATDPARVEATIAADTPLDAAAVDKLGANQRGFGAIEVALFDPTRDDSTMLAAFGAAGSRRGTFAALAGADLRAKITEVRDGWVNGYAKELTTAGRGSATFTSEHQGIDIVVNALVSAAEVLITLHLAQPLGIDKDGTPRPDLLESPRSDASLDDLLAELAGIEAGYLGTYRGQSGLSLSAAVADRNPSADTSMKNALVKAKAALSAIPGPLRTAVVERRDPVLAAHAACREVKRALATEVAGALGTSLGFTVTDGD